MKYLLHSINQGDDNHDGSWKSVFARFRNVTDEPTKSAFYLTLVHLKNESEFSNAIKETIHLSALQQMRLFLVIIMDRPQSSETIFKILRTAFRNSQMTNRSFQQISSFITQLNDGRNWDEENKKEMGSFQYYCEDECQSRWSAVTTKVVAWLQQTEERLGHAAVHNRGPTIVPVRYFIKIRGVFVKNMDDDIPSLKVESSQIKVKLRLKVAADNITQIQFALSPMINEEESSGVPAYLTRKDSEQILGKLASSGILYQTNICVLKYML